MLCWEVVLKKRPSEGPYKDIMVDPASIKFIAKYIFKCFSEHLIKKSEYTWEELAMRGTIQNEMVKGKEVIIPKLAFNVIKAWAIKNESGNGDALMRNIAKCIVRISDCEIRFDSKLFLLYYLKLISLLSTRGKAV